MNDREETIARLWNEGRSAGQIASILNTSRNAISGTVHRMRLSGVKLRGANHGGSAAREKKASEAREKARQANPEVKTVPPQVNPVKAPEPVPAAETIAQPPKTIPFIDRQPLIRAVDQKDIPWDGSRRDVCLWPSWKEGDASRTMCGAPIDPHKPHRYCGTHHRAAYNPRER